MKAVIESVKGWLKGKKKQATDVSKLAKAKGSRKQIRDAFSSPGMKNSIGGQLNTRRKKTESMMKELDKR